MALVDDLAGTIVGNEPSSQEQMLNNGQGRGLAKRGAQARLPPAIAHRLLPYAVVSKRPVEDGKASRARPKQKTPGRPRDRLQSACSSSNYHFQEIPGPQSLYEP